MSVVAAALVTTGAAACAASRPLARHADDVSGGRDHGHKASVTDRKRSAVDACECLGDSTCECLGDSTCHGCDGGNHDAGRPPDAEQQAGPPTDAQWARFDEYLQDRLLGAGDFAFGVAVSIDGVEVHASSFGDRNSPNMVPPPPEPPTESSGASTIATTTTSTTTTVPVVLEPVEVSDRFRIASISKVITGTVALQLVADGTLTLDDPVGELLGDQLGVDVTGRPPAAITVRHLLCATPPGSASSTTRSSPAASSRAARPPLAGWTPESSSIPGRHTSTRR